MTVAEACELLVAATREISAVRGERDAYRLVCQAAIHYAHDVHTELERLRASHQRLLEEFRSSRRKRAA